MILSIGMMLNWLGEKRGDKRLQAAWRGIDKTLDQVLKEKKVRTPDLGGSNKTTEFGDAFIKALLTN
jgi:3-isopropylmalate dehydrogenase